MNRLSVAAVVLIAGLPVTGASAQDLGNEVAALRQMVVEMRNDYEQRIADLEQRLDTAERLAGSASRDAEEAIGLAEEVAIERSAGTSAPNVFNPGIGAILSGFYADVDRGWDGIPGFQPAGEIGSGESGFAVGEAEINMKANVDAGFYGNVTLALHEGEAEIEEAWVQTTQLPAGLTLTGGRIFSAAGYLNSFHNHSDDFVDRPLPYQAFLGGRYALDGLQARWVAPTAILLELGAELDWGAGFPATANAESSPGTRTLLAKVGGDIGFSHSWQAGLARINADARARRNEDDAGAGFSGDSDLTVFDFVWKWAPEGNPTQKNFKLQGEYFRRQESGLFNGIDYDGDQDGWYLQGVWQFAPLWRAGLRYDVVDADAGAELAGTELEDPGRQSSRRSLMFDYSPSEFSRLRLQYTADQVLDDTDQQWFLQYIMSLGAHGSHQF